MISFVKRPIGFALGLLAIGFLENKLSAHLALHPFVSSITNFLAVLLFTILFAYLLQVTLSKPYRYKAAYYVALFTFIIYSIYTVGSYFYKPEALEFKGAVETMPLFMALLFQLGAAALGFVVKWGILYLVITLGNWLASFVVKHKEIL